MLDKAIEILKKLEDHGFKAYIVGGFVRDYLLSIESNDVDINTNAKPKDIIKIFPDASLPGVEYGSVTVYYKNIRFEITTFRKDIEYIDNRHPLEVEYIDNLEEDLKRRDFTINAICMDKNKEIIDPLKGREDLDRKLISTTYDASASFKEDSLRILRAIRFATKLNFSLSSEVERAIIDNKELLKVLSYERKREELDKIFISNNAKYGIELIKKYDLSTCLDIPNIDKITSTDSLIGIWAILDVLDKYKFSNNEKDLIRRIQAGLKEKELDKFTIYKYGLYVSTIIGEIKGISKEKVTRIHSNLAIRGRKEIDLTSDDIVNIYQKEKGPYIKDVYSKLEEAIVKEKVKNNKEELIKFCKNNIGV